jgi:signal peptidase I
MKLRKIILTIGDILFGLILIVAAVGLLSKFNVIPLQILSVRSGSMEPSIKTGSIIVTTPANFYRVNDVVAFTVDDGQETITHRIVALRNTTNGIAYTTKGDANKIPDSFGTTKNEILGKVRLATPWLGYIFTFTKTTTGLIVIIIIPAAFIIISEIKKITKEWKKRQNKKITNLHIHTKQKQKTSKRSNKILIKKIINEAATKQAA